MSVNTILRATSEEIQAISKTHGRLKEDLSADLKYLKDWLKKQPHLPQEVEDSHLEKILRMNKFSLEKTKKKVDMFFSVKNFVPEFFEERNLLTPIMQFHMENVILAPLPKLTEDFSRVHIFSYANNNAENFDLIRHAKFVFAAADLRFFYDDCLTDTYILDMKNCTLGHVFKHNPVICKKAISVIEKAYSDRVKGIHFINLPSYATALVNLANSLISQKMAQRVFVHKDLNSLHQVISKSILPSDFGGDEKSLAEINGEWRKLLENNNSWIMEIGKKKSNEKLRQGNPIDADMFGSIHGSFRQLCVD